MKAFILTLFLVMFAQPAYAEDTVCTANEADGYIHLLKDKTVISIARSGDYMLGRWELFGDHSILIIWASGNKTILSTHIFKMCTI